MIRNNLSTRPFYNERAVHMWLALGALVALLLTVVNVSQILYYSRSDTEDKSEAAREEAQAIEFRRTANELRASVDTQQVEAVSNEARQANELIDRRVFSWTELFNQFESTLPPQVRLTSVSPRLDDGRFLITMTVLARGVDDIDEFLDKLEETGAFREALSRQERVNDTGQLEAALEATYIRRQEGIK